MNGKEKAVLARYAHWQPALGKPAVPHRLPDLLGVENGDKKTGALEINFDGKGAFIKKGGLASINIFDDEGGKLRLGKALQVYKDDKNVLCWITVESKYAIKSCGEKEKV